MWRPTIGLPAELVELVTDNLASDKHSLATCAQLSRVWLPRSRYHLFSTAVANGSSQVASFLQIIESPLCTLKPYINTLIIDNHERYLTPASPATWSALYLLANLQSLTIRHLLLEESPTRGVFRQIKRLTIDSTYFCKFLFFDFLSRFPSLTHLTLQHLCSFHPSTPEKYACLPSTLHQFSSSFDYDTVQVLNKLRRQKKIRSRPRITDMTFTAWRYTEITGEFLNSFGASLKSLRIELTPTTPIHAVYAFGLASKTLTTLSFYSRYDALRVLGLSLASCRLPALTSLTFDILLNGSTPPLYMWSLSPLMQTLHTTLCTLTLLKFRVQLKDCVLLGSPDIVGELNKDPGLLRQYVDAGIRNECNSKEILQVEFV